VTRQPHRPTEFGGCASLGLTGNSTPLRGCRKTQCGFKADAVMFRLRLSIGILLLSAHVLGACDTMKILSPEQTNTLLHGPIQVDMSREDIIKQLGQPFREERRGTTEFLFYQTAWQVTEKATTRSPIALVDDKVVGLGKAYYDNLVKQLAAETITKENAAKSQAWDATVDR
jgi:hypothetical protein